MIFSEMRINRGILLINGNLKEREQIKSVITDEYDIFEAVNGENGLNLLLKNFRTTSLVVLDDEISEISGREFILACQRDKMLKRVPIMVLAGKKGKDKEEEYFNLGVADFVAKPYNLNVLFKRMIALIRLNEATKTLNAVEYDNISGLYTRTSFLHHASTRIAANRDEGFDMMMINIEDFGFINSRYGEHMGDQLLSHIGKKLYSITAEKTISCRYHADRFVLLRKHHECDHDAQMREFDIKLHEDAPISDFVLKFAVYDNIDTSQPINVLVDMLNIAIRTVKHQYNNNISYFDKKMVEKLAMKHEIEERMASALSEGQFKVFYQPKHDIKTGKVVGAEALVRWLSPEHGFLSPADFISVFEENGFITSLDFFVWDTVCKNLAEWKKAGVPIVPVSVNASRRDLISINGTETIMKSIKENKIDKRYLHIEITESYAAENAEILRKIRKIREEGIKIEIDDFGAGQSSLSTLGELPMDFIKLDMNFTRNLVKHRPVVRAIISLSHELGHKIICEGVETDEQLNMLEVMGCDVVQGYIYSKPIPESAFREYLCEHECIEEKDIV